MSLDQALQKLGDVLAEAMTQELRDNGSYDTGDLAKSIQYDVRQQGPTYQLVRSMLEYGIYVDQGDGRGPGRMPPVKPLMDWIKRKSISVPQGLTVESFAFAIAKNIAKKGTNPRPRPFITPAINQVLSRSAEEILGEGATDEALSFIDQQLQDIKVRV